MDLLVRHHGRCAYRGAGGALGRENRVPLSRGGSDAVYNILPACHRCNAKKHRSRERDFRLPPDFDIDIYRRRPPWQVGDLTGAAKIEVGVMFEVPALLWELPQLLPKIDFLSVGTNDLVQFLFAADRGNPKLAQRYDTLLLPVLRLLGEVARACAEHRVPLALCGEMAGQPLDAMALVGIGFRVLSMAPGSIGPVKATIRSLELAPLSELLAALPALREATDAISAML